ncbi:MAG TPA: tRNA (adenosine(37)-N6)-threonylcarbamoyltransferase complex dimerization subunit type 1 TsaB [Bacteroidia bacterium]|nr:tRNA (adenosine(37)-N6)-threonylcarbamoyltransferase complex dimerization subunit type 1 TsaB [Bacteroidia bacterium]
MALILCIETATDVCSVALAKDGFLLAIAESDEPKSHAGIVTKFIDQVMHEGKSELSQLDAISISKGPGSYTGLRIGTATAKGLCYALDKPLIAINTLQSMTAFLLNSYQPQTSPDDYRDKSPAFFIPLIDARRMEVYTAIFDSSLNEISETKAEVISENSFSEILKENNILFFGDGMGKCKKILDSNSNAEFADDFKTSAMGMFLLSEKAFAEKMFEDIAYFEPFYLKDFVGNKPKG